jgi:hypothetical protein
LREAAAGSGDVLLTTIGLGSPEFPTVTDMTLAEAAGRAWRGDPETFSQTPLSAGYQRLVDIVVFVFVVCGAIALVEPSPYDFASFVALPLWLFGGFTVQRSFILFYFLVVLHALIGFFALIPYWSDTDAALYQYQSAYLVVTGIFYALYVGDRTTRRAELILTAFAVSCFIAAGCGVAGYFNLAGLGDAFSRYGRASGTFKDPNVLGSYLILGALYLTHNLLLARARSVLATLAGLALVLAGVFLSFSRGSWGAMIVSLAFMTAAAYATAETRRSRARIVTIALVTVGLAVIVLLALLSIDQTRDFFLQRAALEQSYDQGETGRFGNQLRSLPMLLERFGGFGPLRFRLVFGLEPHNSYIGAFANGGWLGGIVFALLVGVTGAIGVRLMFRPSPYRRQAQVYVPALLGFFLQAFQIDIDHWRHVWLMLGVVWGLEAARRKWMAMLRTPARTQAPPP